MVGQLPERLGQVLSAYYGLDGQPPATYRKIGSQMGLSHSRRAYPPSPAPKHGTIHAMADAAERGGDDGTRR